MPGKTVQTTQVSARAGGQFQALTGLRGVAAWWVVLFHFAGYLPDGVPEWARKVCQNGYLAVDLFFVLSGFILAFNYLPAFEIFDCRRYARFLGVRLARIYPLHIVMLLVFIINPVAIWLAASTDIETYRYRPSYFGLSVVLLQNWGLTDQVAWNIPAWSISTEWFAYVCFPLVGWLANRVRQSNCWSALGVFIPMAALGICLAIEGAPLGGNIARDGLLRCLTEFTAGVFLYRVWLDCGRFRLAPVVAGALASGCAGLYYLTDIADYWLFPLAWTALIFALATGLRPLCALLSSRVMQFVGATSYATYLVHYFVRDWVKFLLIHEGATTYLPLLCYLAATAAASVVLYQRIEVPGRRALRRQLDRFMPASV